MSNILDRIQQGTGWRVESSEKRDHTAEEIKAYGESALFRIHKRLREKMGEPPLSPAEDLAAQKSDLWEEVLDDVHDRFDGWIGNLYVGDDRRRI